MSTYGTNTPGSISKTVGADTFYLAPTSTTTQTQQNNAVSQGFTATPSISPTTTSTATKVTTPVVTSNSAQEDFNNKQKAYNDLIAGIENQSIRLNAQQAEQANAKAQADLQASKQKLDEQNLAIKQQEANTKSQVAQGLTQENTPSTAPTPTNAPQGTTAPQTIPVAPTSTAPTTTSTTAEQVNTQNATAQNQILDAKTSSYNTFQNQVAQLMNGTFPLSADQQAIVQSVQSSLDRQKASITGVMSMEAARGGQEYTPGQMASNLVAKTMDLDASAAGQMASLRKGFMSQDYELINSAYEKQQKFLDDKAATIQKLHDTVLATEKEQRAQQQKVTDSINKIAQDAAKNGATPEQVAKITASKSESEAINNAGDLLQTATGTMGEYLAYKRATINKGLVPKDYETYKNEQLAKEEKIKADAKNKSDAQFTLSDKNQQKLEQQYRQVLGKEFSSRQGALGIENAKVNQANHLNSLITQYYDPKTGDYNIPKSQYGELVLGLANLVSPSSVASDSLRAEINTRTAKGDFAGALSYVTGAPQNGNTQDIIKNFIDSIDRQAETAVRNREAALQNMRDQAPTDLEQERIDKLNKSTNMVKFEGQDRISKANINNYIKSNPAEAENIAKMYEIPGATDQDIEEYLKANGKI